MAGARATGKSIFIAVMIKQLELLAAQRGALLEPTPATARVLEEHYVGPLYEQRGIMGATVSAAVKDAYQRDPLVFALTPRNGPAHHLVIRDVAGEDLEKDEPDEQELGFFARADAVFFLFDPLKVPEIADRLRDHLPHHDLGGDPRRVLRSVLRLLGSRAPRLAMILSKFDAMHDLRSIEGGGDWSRIMQNPGAAMVRDPGPIAAANDDDGQLLHAEVHSLLVELQATVFLSTVEQAVGEQGQLRYFAVSALGGSPDGTRLNARGIAPFRCLDPLRWALRGQVAI
ncbi:hypothetical protein [Actinomycetospora sp. CA-084318]|uniref:hypothetical protein n=1 Tax=Actinomycetospora sp. CA-084318 TaxID=3239892 RepID=UPI003D99FE97